MNAFGCFRNASASVLPASTSNTTARVTSFSVAFSVCLLRMSSDCTSGRPALIIVANCRVKITMSRVLTLGLPKLKLSLIGFGASRRLTSIIRFFRRYEVTSSLEGTSSCPFWIWPVCGLRAVYSKSGIGPSPG